MLTVYRLALSMSLILLVCGLGAAQFVSAEVSPNPVAAGQPIAIKIEATTPSDIMPGCGFAAIHAGSPAGPIVYQPFICPSLRILVGPGGSYTAKWNALVNNQPLTPGDYYVQILWRPVSNPGKAWSHWVPFRVDPVSGPTLPVLSTTTAAQRGQTLLVKLSSPSQVSASAILAASLTTNTGLNLSPSQHLALDLDFLFYLSFPVPNPFLFTNFQGVLNVKGELVGAIQIPNVPTLQGAQIAVQGVVIDKNGVTLSNGITRIIG